MADKFRSKTQHEFQVTLENYIKAIWNLSQNSQELRNVDLARYLGVTRASVTGMLKKLESQKYVFKTRNTIQLSIKGKELALVTLRKHRLVEMFLSRTLKLSGLELHDEAEVLEHALSPTLLDKMDEFLGYPKVDDSGMTIPQKGKKAHLDFASDCLPLMQVREGSHVKVVSIADYNSQSLPALTQKGLRVGQRLSVLEKKEDSYIHIEVPKQRTVVLSQEEARLIRVSEVV
jgi:DtxR family Mn-dependent transcriptional regulator